MPVQLIVDCFGIDNQTAVIVDTSDASIDAARHAIYQKLRAKDPTLLRIKINNQALFKHFREFEGSLGFSVQHLKPRLLLADRFKTALPVWLTDECIVALGLLKNPDQIPNLPFAEQLLTACHPDLLNGQNFNTFVAALHQQTPAFLLIIKQEAIKKAFFHVLHHLNINKDAAELFIDQLQQQQNISRFLQNLASQQYLLHLRRFVSEYQLNLALPAQALPSALLTALPLLPLPETEAQQLPELFLAVLKAFCQKIIAQQLAPELLAPLLVMDLDRIWTELIQLTEDQPVLISPALVKQLQNFNSATAQQLAEHYDHYLNACCYPLLSETASVDEALIWSQGYFDYLRPLLLNKQTPEETINQSFSHWLLAQSARIARSNADWRYCAKQIDKFLAQNYLVVVVMVDALSALNQDVLLTELTGFEQLTHTDEILFAPLPTLTEVGKMAVLTGKHSYLLPSDSEAALTQTYAPYLTEPNALKVIKSWEDVSQHIGTETNLVVFFENRIDERLHDCVSFAKHREDIIPIARQLKRSMQRWLKDAAQREMVFFITADHGMTVTQGSYSGALLGDIKDRTLKIQFGDSIAEDFVQIAQDSKNPYAVIKNRQTLTNNTSLAHGGLTPEEVLIPFITLTTRPPKLNEMPVKVCIIGHCLRLGNKHWQIELRLTAAEQVENIKLSLEPPFLLEKRPLIDIIRADKALDITLKFTADCEQEGLIALGLQLHYDRSIAHEKNTQPLNVNFPPPLLERDAGTQSFEDMF